MKIRNKQDFVSSFKTNNTRVYFSCVGNDIKKVVDQRTTNQLKAILDELVKNSPATAGGHNVFIPVDVETGIHKRLSSILDILETVPLGVRIGGMQSNIDVENESWMTLKAASLGIGPSIFAVFPYSTFGQSVMFMLRGTPLYNLLEGDVPLERITALSQPLREMFEKCAEHRLILSDIKPGNVIVYQGKILFIDFDPSFSMFSSKTGKECCILINVTLFLGFMLCQYCPSHIEKLVELMGYTLVLLHDTPVKADDLCEALKKTTYSLRHNALFDHEQSDEHNALVLVLQAIHYQKSIKGTMCHKPPPYWPGFFEFATGRKFSSVSEL